MNKGSKLYKCFSFVYQLLIGKWKYGFYPFMLKYFFLIRRREILELKKLGFDNLRIYKTDSWRIGVENDHAYRRYYLAKFNGRECFVKIAQNDSTVNNEIYVADRIKGYKMSFTPEVIYTSTEFLDNRNLLVLEFIDGLRPLSEALSKDNTSAFCNQFLLILNTLKAINLIHADIHKGNLMLDKDNNLILLDFGISIFKDEKNNVDYKSHPGTYYQEKDCIRIYDDAFSFVQMIRQLHVHDYIKDDEAYNEIYNRIGNFYADINMNDYK